MIIKKINASSHDSELGCAERNTLSYRIYQVKCWWNECVIYPAPAWFKDLYYPTVRWLYDNINCRLNPRQKWLTSSIPNTWHDKVELIRDVLYTMVVHFVEVEKCFEHNDWEYTKEQSEKGKQLKEIYHWIKLGRAEFVKQIDAAFPPIREDLSYAEHLLNRTEEQKAEDHKAYDKVWELEKQLEEYDNKCLVWIVENRSLLWV